MLDDRNATVSGRQMDGLGVWDRNANATGWHALLGDQIGNTYLEAQQQAGNFAPLPVSVSDLFAGALIPGLMLVAFYAVYVTLVMRPGRQGTKPPSLPTPMEH